MQHTQTSSPAKLVAPLTARHNPIRRHAWLVWLAAAALLIHVAGVDELFAYQRQRIGQGEIWRLLTGHFAHLSTMHLLENLAALFLIGWLFGHLFTPRGWLSIATLTTLAISAAFYLLNPALHWYVGLSGLLHGLLVAGLFAQLYRREATAMAWLLLGMVIIKLTWEQLAGPLPGTEQLAGGTVIVAAHLYGAIAGGIAALALFVLRQAATE